MSPELCSLCGFKATDFLPPKYLLAWPSVGILTVKPVSWGPPGDVEDVILVLGASLLMMSITWREEEDFRVMTFCPEEGKKHSQVVLEARREISATQ